MWSKIKRACRKFGNGCIKVATAAVLCIPRIVTVVVETFCEVFSQEPAPATTPASFTPAAAPVRQHALGTLTHPTPTPSIPTGPASASSANRAPVAPTHPAPAAGASDASVPSAAAPVTASVGQSSTHAVGLKSLSPIGAESCTATKQSADPTRAAPSTLNPPRARGCRIQFVIVYLVVIAILKSIGIGWVPIATSIARDFVSRCRALQEPLARALDKLCQWFPALQKFRGLLAYAMGVEPGQALWHRVIHEADMRIESLWEALAHRFESLVLSVDTA